MLHLYVPPSISSFEPRLLRPSTSDARTAFEYDFARALRPGLIVDVGGGDGSSFFTYCQAARDRGFPTVAFVVDDWDHPRMPGMPGLNEFREFLRRQYLGIATWMQSAPAELLPHFREGSVDLLRLDSSLRLAPDVTAEWVKRVSPRGALVVAGIDTPMGASTWEIAQQGREPFTLPDVGVALPHEINVDEPLLGMLRAPDEHAGLRLFYEHVGEFQRLRREADLHEARAQR